MSSNKFLMIYSAQGLKTIEDARRDAEKALESGDSDKAFIYELIETIRVERKIKRESHRPPSGIQLEETT